MEKLFIIVLVLFSMVMASAQTIGLDNDKKESDHEFVNECEKNLASIAEYLQQKDLEEQKDLKVCPEQTISTSIPAALASVINVGIGKMSIEDKKFIIDSSLKISPDKKEIESRILASSKNDKDLEEALDFLKKNNIPWKVTTPTENKECGGASALAYPPASSGGIRVEICEKSNTWPTLRKNIIHEVLHIKQYLGTSKDHKSIAHVHGQSYELDLFKKYEADRTIYETKNDLISLETEKEKKLDAVTNELFGIEKFFYINYNGSKLSLTPKKPSGVSLEKFYSDLEKWGTRSGKTSGQLIQMFYPEMSEALNNIPHTSTKDFFEKYTTSLNNKIDELKQGSSSAEVEKFNKHLDLALVGRNRIIPQIKSFCTEMQAYINDFNSMYNNYKKLSSLIPSCLENNPYFEKENPPEFTSNQEYIYWIEKNVLKVFNKGSIYSSLFSELYGMNDFKEIFNAKNCTNPSPELFRYEP